MARSLVVARVGAASLHPAWLDGSAGLDWDVLLVPYEPLPPGATDGCLTGRLSSEVLVGPKWTGVREALHDWEGWRDYDYVWMPDDDILTDHRTISAMFRVARALDLDLFAPALTEDSHFAHFATMRNRSFAGRWTGFVEIMMPGFSVPVLEKLLWTLDLTRTGWGWGLDSLWPHLLGHRGVAVLDHLAMRHTRPVGVMRDEDLARRVRQESDAILTEYCCRQVHTTYGAFGPDLARLELSPEEFFARLVRGWQYLIDEDPRILTWLVDYQQGLFRWPAYPVEGTP